MTAVTVVVPWRDSGDAHRRRNHDHVVAHLHQEGWRVVERSGPSEGKFNRGRAYNDALRDPDLSDTDVWVWHEADVVCPKPQLEAAVALAASSPPGVVVPFTDYLYLTDAGTRQVIAGTTPGEAQHDPQRSLSGGISVGALTVASTETMRANRGYDEVFAGWGWDDTAYFYASRRLAGPPMWVPGPMHHLYHPPAWDLTKPGQGAPDNQARFRRYERSTDQHLMALIEERRAPIPLLARP